MIKFLFLFLSSFDFLKPQLNLQLIAEGFDQPLYVTSYPDNSKILLVVEQDGIIKKIINNEIYDFLDISDRVHQTWYPADERGLLGLAFDPNFKSNNYFYGS